LVLLDHSPTVSAPARRDLISSPERCMRVRSTKASFRPAGGLHLSPRAERNALPALGGHDQLRVMRHQIACSPHPCDPSRVESYTSSVNAPAPASKAPSATRDTVNAQASSLAWSCCHPMLRISHRHHFAALLARSWSQLDSVIQACRVASPPAELPGTALHSAPTAATTNHCRAYIQFTFPRPY